MKLILWGHFISSFLASVNNQLGAIQKIYNPAYMKELAITHDKVSLNRRRKEEPFITFLGELGGTLDVSKLADLPKIFSDVPPVKLEEPRNIKYGTFKEVREHLEHSLLSFCPLEDTIGYECVCREKYDHITSHENDDMDSMATVAVHRTKKTIFVSYRPSLKAKNWISNLNYEMSQFPGAPTGTLAHRGFLNYFMTTHNSTLNAVTEILKKPELCDYDLLISGISLGSAISTISLPFWADLLKSLNDKRKLHAFIYSGPRVGNELFAQYLAGLSIPITRYTNGNDVIPHLPPRSFGFVHVGAEIHEIDNGLQGEVQLKVCSQEYDEDPECGYKDSDPPSFIRHSMVFGKPFPFPPYC